MADQEVLIHLVVVEEVVDKELQDRLGLQIQALVEEVLEAMQAMLVQEVEQVNI
jgi:hypothetical protein